MIGLGLTQSLLGDTHLGELSLEVGLLLASVPGSLLDLGVLVDLCPEVPVRPLEERCGILLRVRHRIIIYLGPSLIDGPVDFVQSCLEVGVSLLANSSVLLEIPDEPSVRLLQGFDLRWLRRLLGRSRILRCL